MRTALIVLGCMVFVLLGRLAIGQPPGKFKDPAKMKEPKVKEAPPAPDASVPSSRAESDRLRRAFAVLLIVFAGYFIARQAST